MNTTYEVNKSRLKHMIKERDRLKKKLRIARQGIPKMTMVSKEVKAALHRRLNEMYSIFLSTSDSIKEMEVFYGVKKEITQ